MSKKATLYSLIAAVVATVFSALVYAGATSNMNAYVDTGEGTAAQTAREMNLVTLSRALLIITAVATIVTFIRFVTLKPDASKSAPVSNARS